MLLGLLSVSSPFASVIAAPHAAPRVVHEKRALPALGRGDRVDPDSIIPVRIGLKQSNLDSGYDRLMEVSHPSSENYGKHLSAAQVHDLFAPNEETLAAVKEWLIFAGVDASSTKGYVKKGWLAIDMPAWQAEDPLSTEYYEHDSKTALGLGAMITLCPQASPLTSITSSQALRCRHRSRRGS